MRHLLLFAACSAVAFADGVYLDGPEVVKLDWNTTGLRSADFNGDGLADLVLINRDRARIEFLLQRKEGPRPGEPERSSRPDRWNPVLEISRLDKQPLVIGRLAHALAVGDWNGDGRPDIAYTTDDKKLVLRRQDAQGGWADKTEFVLDSVSEDPESLLARDLDGDGRADLALLTETRLRVWRQPASGAWGEPRVYAVGETDCGGLRSADLDGDGRADLFCTASEGDAVLVRLQQPGVAFGEEWRLQIPQSRCWVQPLRLRGGSQGLAWIRDDTGMVEVARLARAAVAGDSDRAASIRHAVPAADAKSGASAFGDLDGDGHADVVLAEPKNARLWFFAGRADGGFAEGREFPALSGVEGLAVADVDGDGKAELLLLSPAEKTLGLSRWRKGRLTYPESLHQTGDTLLALTAGPFGAAAAPAVLVLTEAKGRTSLLTLRWEAAKKQFATATLDLPCAPLKPSALRLVDADQDGRNDLALFSSLAPMQILLARDGSPAFRRAEGLPDNLLNKLAPAALTTADLDGDGRAEVIVARDQLARAFRVGADGKAVTVEQFNAPEAGAQISAVVVATEEGRPRTLLADTTARKLYEMTPDADGVFRASHTHALSALTPDECRLVQRGGDSALLMIGKTVFDLNPFTGTALALETVASFDTELKDTTATDLLPAAFSGVPDSDDLLCIDNGASRVLELFSADKTPSAPWLSRLFFRVFEVDPQYRGKVGLSNEPHDYLAPDLDGDGKPDLALLVHDRLLLYLRR